MSHLYLLYSLKILLKGIDYNLNLNIFFIFSDDIENDIDDINNSIPEELTSDFVTPIKVHNFSLNADDLLYESKRNLNTPNNNHNGKFKETFLKETVHRTCYRPDYRPEYMLDYRL